MLNSIPINVDHAGRVGKNETKGNNSDDQRRVKLSKNFQHNSMLRTRMATVLSAGTNATASITDASVLVASSRSKGTLGSSTRSNSKAISGITPAKGMDASVDTSTTPSALTPLNSRHQGQNSYVGGESSTAAVAANLDIRALVFPEEDPDDNCRLTKIEGPNPTGRTSQRKPQHHRHASQGSPRPEQHFLTQRNVATTNMGTDKENSEFSIDPGHYRYPVVTRREQHRSVSQGRSAQRNNTTRTSTSFKKTRHLSSSSPQLHHGHSRSHSLGGSSHCSTPINRQSGRRLSPETPGLNDHQHHDFAATAPNTGLSERRKSSKRRSSTPMTTTNLFQGQSSGCISDDLGNSDRSQRHQSPPHPHCHNGGGSSCNTSLTLSSDDSAGSWSPSRTPGKTKHHSCSNKRKIKHDYSSCLWLLCFSEWIRHSRPAAAVTKTARNTRSSATVWLLCFVSLCFMSGTAIFTTMTVMTTSSFPAIISVSFESNNNHDSTSVRILTGNAASNAATVDSADLIMYQPSAGLRGKLVQDAATGGLHFYPNEEETRADDAAKSKKRHHHVSNDKGMYKKKSENYEKQDSKKKYDSDHTKNQKVLKKHKRETTKTTKKTTVDHVTKHDEKHKSPPKNEHHSRNNERKHSQNSGNNLNKGTVKPRSIPRVVLPPKKVGFAERTFELQDGFLYLKPKLSKDSSAVATTAKHHSRVVLLDGSFSRSVPKYRRVKQYPADFTDNTQLYSILDSGDERVRKMELREPLVKGECVPMKEWQTTFHPTCNQIHEVGMERVGDDTEDSDFLLFGTKGYWRNAWRVDLANGSKKQRMDTVVLKTLKTEHKFEEAHFEHDRIDAVAMERLTASPHVINSFGFCGHSVLTEYADGKRLGALADSKRKTPLARLEIARDTAAGLADVHSIDGPNNVTFVHLDINPANVISVGGTLKLNDFNIGIIRRWNTTSNQPCGFPAQYPNPQWRSPEEARNEQDLTEKVDVFSLGHILFRLICGNEPWNKLETGGKPSKTDVNEKVSKGVLPTIPLDVLNSTEPEVVAIRDAMLRCYTYNPVDRPSAREIADSLQTALDKIKLSAKPK